MRKLVCLSVVLLLSLLGSVPASADELTVAAASDLSFAFEEMKVAFEQQTGHTLRLVLGSSGNLFAQMQNGAPFDLFFSADIAYPQQLEAAGLTEPGTLYRYAVGRLVLWVPRGSPLDPVRQQMGTLLDPRVKTIAIANPRHAPYGRAAAAALEQFGLYDKVKDKLVLGENISQAAQFVESGSADAGLLALSLAVAPAMRARGKFWEIPADAYPRLEQGAVVLKSSSHRAAARAFLDYVKSAAGRALLARYGFSLPAQSEEDLVEEKEK